MLRSMLIDFTPAACSASTTRPPSCSPWSRALGQCRVHGRDCLTCAAELGSNKAPAVVTLMFQARLHAFTSKAAHLQVLGQGWSWMKLLLRNAVTCTFCMRASTSDMGSRVQGLP